MSYYHHKSNSILEITLLNLLIYFEITENVIHFYFSYDNQMPD